VYYRFVRTRENHPKVSFDVGLAFVGVHRGQWLTEVVAEIENRGLVEHEVHNFKFEVLYLRGDEQLQESQESDRQQIIIPTRLKAGYWIKSPTVIDPGVRARYPFVVALPANASFVRVKGEFIWKEGTVHKASRLFAVPAPSHPSDSQKHDSRNN
jgi:hypothetical protein